MSKKHKNPRGCSVCTFEPDVRSLEQLYSFRRQAEVLQFLEAHPFLVPLLVEAHSKIGDYFGSNPEVALEVVTDPEAIDDHELFAFIRTSLPADEAHDRLDRLGEEWWLDAMERAQGKLCIDMEFQ